jgi:hypothetical protein
MRAESTPHGVEVTNSHFLRALAVGTAALVATGGYVHLCLYRHGYRAIPKIGVGFLLQAVTSAVVVAALLVGPHVVGRLAHVTDGLADTLTRATAAVLAAGTLVAFALSRTSHGLFNFRERGLEPAPQALLALVSEVAVLTAVALWLVARHVRDRPSHLAATAV